MHLHDTDARANIDEKVRENTRIDVRESRFGVSVALIYKNFVVNVLQEKITAFDKASHLFFFVNPVADCEGK